MKKLLHTLSLFDAVNIALGAIIGAGIFVVIGTAAGLAGPALFISVLIAAAVAALTGIASAGLSKIYPKTGGAYTFANEALSPSAGFVTGWVWIFSNVLAGATVAVGFGYYLEYFAPFIPSNIGAALAVILVVGINLLGMKNSSRVNNALVVLKVLIILFFIASAIFYIKKENFSPLMPFGIEGVIAGAAAIFFAYGGFARVAVVAGEVKEPAKNVPKAILISIIISTILYLAVAISAVGIAGYAKLASSGSPLADAMQSNGLSFGAMLMAFGALIATGTVALSVMLGLSRVAYTMAQNKQLPKYFTKLNNADVPKNSIIASGLAMLALALVADLPSIAYISSFSLLFYYAAINLSAINVLKGKTRCIAFAGLLSCAILMASLPKIAWISGALIVLLGILYYALVVKERKK